jgi:hypothetical protein
VIYELIRYARARTAEIALDLAELVHPERVRYVTLTDRDAR